MREEVSTWRIIRTDGPVMFAVMATIATVAAEIGIVFIPGPGESSIPGPKTLLILVVAPLLFAIPAIWWIRVTKKVLSEGRMVSGTITTIEHSEAIVVRYAFLIEGHEVLGVAHSTNNRRLKRLNAGSPVTVFYDPRHSKRRFIRELYVD
jgi:hypothetical protein